MAKLHHNIIEAFMTIFGTDMVNEWESEYLLARAEQAATQMMSWAPIAELPVIISDLEKALTMEDHEMLDQLDDASACYWTDADADRNTLSEILEVMLKAAIYRQEWETKKKEV